MKSEGSDKRKDPVARVAAPRDVRVIVSKQRRELQERAVDRDAYSTIKPSFSRALAISSRVMSP